MRAARPHRLNVVGPFYVSDDCCTACGVPEAEAPELFAWEEGTSHCYVSRQPSNPDELARMVRAVAAAELSCIRYRGRDPVILAALADIGEIAQCDHPGWAHLRQRLRDWWRAP